MNELLFVNSNATFYQDFIKFFLLIDDYYVGLC